MDFTKSLIILMSAVCADAYFRKDKAVVQKPRGIHALNQLLVGNKDPTQDIRTNIVLNLEGF